MNDRLNMKSSPNADADLDDLNVADMTSDEAAAYWDARLRSPDCTNADRAAFRRWRDASSENKAAFEDMENLLSALREDENAPDIRAMREEALSFAERTQGRRRIVWGAGLAAGLVFVVVSMSLVINSGAPWRTPDADQTIAMNAPPFYATAVGERLTVPLEDGSTAVLNTDTRIRVDYSDTDRLVTLLKGQALFEVAENRDRPFIVAAGDQRIRALGTVFDVRLIEDEVKVTLVEGLVEVVEEKGSAASTLDAHAATKLIPGQQLVASLAKNTAHIRETDAERATIWREGRVFFEDVTLREAVAEMNRYTTTRIVASDPALKQFRVNGVFFTGEQSNFIGALEGYFPVKAERRTNGDIVIKMSRN